MPWQHRPPHLIVLSVARVAPEKRNRHRLPPITRQATRRGCYGFTKTKRPYCKPV
nr:MAG TPA: hypothetical protein [Caudoviricetes sp.]